MSNYSIEAEIKANISKYRKAIQSAKRVTQSFKREADRAKNTELDADSAPLRRNVKSAKRILENFTRRKAKKEIDADSKGFMKKAAEVMVVAKTLTKKKIVIPIEATVRDFQRAVGRIANNIEALGTIIRNTLKGALISISPAIVPVIASITGAIGALGPIAATSAANVIGLASAFGLAGAGAAAFGAIAVSNLNDVFAANKDLKDLQEELANTTDLEKRNEIMKEMASIQASLTKEQKKALSSMQELKKTWAGITKELEKPTLRTFSKGMEVLRSVLTKLKPMFSSVTKAAERLMDSLSKSINTKPMEAFFNYLNKEAGPMMERMGKATGNFIQGFMSLAVAFAPLTDSVSQGFLNMSESFATWASKVSASQGFQNFIAYVQENGPKITDILGNITMGLVGMFSAFGPLAADMLTGLQSLTEKFQQWGMTLSENQQFQQFLAYIRENAPTVLTLIGNITQFMINLGVALAPIGSVILNLVTNIIGWTNSMMETHPWIGKIIAVVIVLSGLLMALVPNILAVAETFKNFGATFPWVTNLITTTFSNFKLLLMTGLRMLGDSFNKLAVRVYLTATKVGTSFLNMSSKAVSWAVGMVTQIARVIARFVVLSAKAALHAAKVALSFTVTMVRAAVIWAARTAVQIAKVIARMAVLAARAAANAARVALSFTVTMAQAAAKAAASMARNIAKMIAKYALLAAKSMVHAARVAASWFIAMGPVGWVIGIIASVAAAVIANWDKIKDWTIKTWDKVWGKVKEIGDKIKGFFEGLDLYQSGKAIIQSAIDGIMDMKDKIVGKVEDIVGAVRDLWPFSPAKEGPLSDIHKMDFAGPIGKSIDRAKKPLRKASEELAMVTRNAVNPDIQFKTSKITSSLRNLNRKSLAQVKSAINADVSVSKQPVNINIRIGRTEFREFVEDITDQQLRGAFSDSKIKF